MDVTVEKNASFSLDDVVTIETSLVFPTSFPHKVLFIRGFLVHY